MAVIAIMNHIHDMAMATMAIERLVAHHRRNHEKLLTTGHNTWSSPTTIRQSLPGSSHECS